MMMSCAILCLVLLAAPQALASRAMLQVEPPAVEALPLVPDVGTPLATTPMPTPAVDPAVPVNPEPSMAAAAATPDASTTPPLDQLPIATQSDSDAASATTGIPVAPTPLETTPPTTPLLQDPADVDTTAAVRRSSKRGKRAGTVGAAATSYSFAWVPVTYDANPGVYGHECSRACAAKYPSNTYRSTNGGTSSAGPLCSWVYNGARLYGYWVARPTTSGTLSYVKCYGRDRYNVQQMATSAQFDCGCTTCVGDTCDGYYWSTTLSTATTNQVCRWWRGAPYNLYYLGSLVYNSQYARYECNTYQAKATSPISKMIHV